VKKQAREVRMMISEVKRRDGTISRFDQRRITQAIFKAAESVGGRDTEEAERISNKVTEVLDNNSSDIPTVEQIQDTVEKVLIEEGHAKTAKAYILHRAKHAEERATKTGVKKEIEEMFAHKSKLAKLVDPARIAAYKSLYAMLVKMQQSGEIQVHEDYLGGNELAKNIYHKKYCLKHLDENLIETKPEEVFVRLAAFIASVEVSEEKQKEFAVKFYNDLYNGHYLPGGRVLAGAGDLYRLKTLANCFVSLIEDDNIESIYNAAYEAARTYSYGGGIGIDISNLRPKDAVVHNAADKSTGAVSFMELYSLTTGLIGQSGRRGALMLTLDVKHPEILNFINVKKNNNWVTEQIMKQCEWSNKFDKEQLEEVGKQVRENTQIRFANISIKVSDEFMQAVSEQTENGPDKVLVYKRPKDIIVKAKQTKDNHYSYGMPSKEIKKYEQIKEFNDVKELNSYLNAEYNTEISEKNLQDTNKRDVFGDLIIKIEGADYDLAIKYAGDYLLYYDSDNTGEIKNLVKARDIWNLFVSSNYKTAEPGLIFWTTMTKYSPSNYVDRPISSTNPCGEVPLEDGGACNLGSLNLSRFVDEGYTEKAKVRWDELKTATINLTRFLDNVVTWNQALNALEKQRNAAEETRRTGLGVMGIADMFNQLGIEYDSEEGVALLDKVMKFIANASYDAGADLAEEKEPFKAYDADKYNESLFLKEVIDPEIQEKIKKNGIRNVAILSIAPTGTISNAILGFKGNKKNYIGVSGGIEPVFALYYTRRSESFNRSFNVFHSTVQAYLDIKGLNDKVKDAKSEDDLKGTLPEYFFRTAHKIKAHKRVEIQGVAQKYIDQSISSTVNLGEDINPEAISKIYLDAWEKKLKGITIYRDGSRYPILSVEQQKSEYQRIRSKTYEVEMAKGTQTVSGDMVLTLPSGELTTPYHLLQNPIEGITVKEVVGEQGIVIEKEVKPVVEEVAKQEVKENPCNECGVEMQMKEGCATCPECGYSPCSIKI
jgi:ribonucleoside-diphosphate reductase alpha chain